LDLRSLVLGGGYRLEAFSRSADEEFLGFFVVITSYSLINFFKKTELPIYMCIAEAAEALADVMDPEGESLALRLLAPTLNSIRDEDERAETALSPP
jgi:hypothetical protein